MICQLKPGESRHKATTLKAGGIKLPANTQEQPDPLVIAPYLTGERYIEVYHNCAFFIRYRIEHGDKRPPRRMKDDIKGFSPASRLRALQWLNMLQVDRLQKPVFVTTTFHDTYPADAVTLKKILDKFLKRFKRQWPGSVYFWRVEYQKRGAPHFHFIFWQTLGNQPWDENELAVWVCNNWNALNLCGCKHCVSYSTRVDAVTDFDRAKKYVAKYLAKNSDNVGEYLLKRQWGGSKDAPRDEHAFIFKSKDYSVKVQLALIKWMRAFARTNQEFLRRLQYKQSFFVFVPAYVVIRIRDAINAGIDDPEEIVSKAFDAETGEPLKSVGARWQ